MAVSVLIPWRGGCPYREAALRRVTVFYEAKGWPVVLGQDDSGGSWIKAKAIDAALAEATGDILVVSDADVICEGVEDAVAAVEAGASWAVPHYFVRRLAADGTAEDERPYPGLEGGGIVVLPREVILSCPPDPRFVGWG